MIEELKAALALPEEHGDTIGALQEAAEKLINAFEASRLFTYADLSTAHLPQKEFEDITAAPPRVIKHEFGAWVNVTAVDDTEEGWDDFPALLGVLQWADEQGARWVNFDQDGEFVSVLDTWEW